METATIEDKLISDEILDLSKKRNTIDEVESNFMKDFLEKYRSYLKQILPKKFLDNYGNLLVLYIFFSDLWDKNSIVYGENWPTQNRIYVNNTQPDTDMTKILYHEVAHSVNPYALEGMIRKIASMSELHPVNAITARYALQFRN